MGQRVPVNSFTSYDSLGNLVRQFNAVVETFDSGLVVDETVVELRDLLAHGRVLTF